VVCRAPSTRDNTPSEFYETLNLLVHKVFPVNLRVLTDKFGKYEMAKMPLSKLLLLTEGSIRIANRVELKRERFEDQLRSA
jgi:hypothetical protein